MMTIEWNKVTWYSKTLAIVVFLATFVIAFNLGILWEQTHIETSLITTLNPVSTPKVGGAGTHCGGFIRNAPTCATGFHCQLGRIPDGGGTCVIGAVASSTSGGAVTIPAWAAGMPIITQASRGTAVHLVRNEHFAVEFGNQLLWHLAFSPENAITRVQGSISSGGFQGIYVADKTGTVTLTAAGAPICKKGEMCPQFLVDVTVTLVIGN